MITEINFFSFFFGNLGQVVSLFARLWFLWLPIVTAYLFWNTWLGWVRFRFVRKLTWTLLEIKVPRDVFKSPRAMEVVLSSFYSARQGDFWERIVKGFLPPWYSLEIASIGSHIHFFIYIQKSFRNLVESQFYAQYPNVEITEVDDYTYMSDFNNLDKYEIWGAEIGLAKPDSYPIRTYEDFGLHDAMQKEEQKTNPMVSFLEFLGSLKDGEQVWFQVMIRGAGKKWIKDANKTIDELLGRGAYSEDERKVLSKGEQEVVTAIERNISKTAFETGIRIMYIANKETFNSINKASVFGLLNQYNAQNLNAFKPLKTTKAEWALKARREYRKKQVMFDAYRKRSYFYTPHIRKSFVFNVEEIATIYHFPGRVAETPTFSRVEAKKGEPPLNLPT